MKQIVSTWLETSDWEDTSFGAIAEFINGYGFKPADWSRFGLPIVRIEQMLNPSAESDCYEGQLPEQFRVDNGSLLFSWSATLASVIWDRGPAWLNQHLFRVVPKGKNQVRFLHHLIEFHIERLASQSHGTTMRHIKRADLLPYRVKLPKPIEQSRIAAVLDTADEAIAKTEAVIAKLRQVRAGLLHDLLTRGLDENGQLRDAVTHPEQFQDSPLGRIPREWRVCELGDQLLHPPRNGYSPQEAPVFHARYILGLGCLTTEGFAPLQLKNAPLDAGLDPFLLHDEDLLISRSNTRELVALPGLFRDVGYPCYYPDLMMRLVPAHILSSEFLELLLRHSQSRRRLVASATGTSGSMVKITGGGVMEIPIAFPPRDESDEQQRISGAKHAIDDELRIVVQEITKLKSLKFGLMNDLLTGRVRVPAGIAVTG